MPTVKREMFQDLQACQMAYDFADQYNLWGAPEEQILSIAAEHNNIVGPAWWAAQKTTPASMWIINNHFPGFCAWGGYKSADGFHTGDTLEQCLASIDAHRTAFIAGNGHITVLHSEYNADGDLMQQVVDLATTTLTDSFSVFDAIAGTYTNGLTYQQAVEQYAIESAKVLALFEVNHKVFRALTNIDGVTVWVSIDDPLLAT